ncbi:MULTISPECIES: LysR family transcriptional regulator [unclassified Duganella]|uniref:LysR family transcriptional regulator n=1 Tax=unclassified Duganella TaxID=2636909 RepID=UPI0006F44988|nr:MULTISPECIES: LysR family transcriptional regulator [unclassified Duganella]KQV53826.1 LysR family transcriptional regulator [Duganella sp. Root336D2]KRB83621.1 LysR family transcriptional regulator [Duganella sp. Root198D2]
MRRHFDDMQLGSIELFVLAAEQGSFTAAAALAGVTPAAVSRSISRLEERLGVRLFVRTTRQIRLTDGGKVYFEQCRQALSQLVEAEREVTGQQAAPSGKLRISVPTPYAHYRLLERVAAFRVQFPEVQVEIHVSNRNIDFAEEGYDLAVRGRAPQDSTLIARKLEDAALVLVASPSYLKRRGMPRSLEELADHECIQFVLPSTGRLIPWQFMRDGAQIELAGSDAIVCAEDFLGMGTLAVHGGGIAQTYRFAVERELASGVLVELLPQHGGCSRPFYLIYPHARHLSLRVRSFVEFVLR